MGETNSKIWCMEQVIKNMHWYNVLIDKLCKVI